MAGAHLPAATSALVGRDDQVVALAALLSGGSSRLLTLTGPPGVGKTRLALAVATRAASTFALGVAWVELGQLRDCAQVPVALSRALGLDRSDGARGPAADPLDRDVLLVVDNYEHLLDAAPAVGELLDRCPGLRVLATSRQRLHLLAETEYPVPPLPVPPATGADDLGGLAGNPAVQLVLAHSPAHVMLTRRTALPLAEICRRLDGLPLALELAAARLRVFTPGELLFRLEHRTVDLFGLPRDAPARHRTLGAAIEWSHDLLPDAERTVLRRLAVLVGGWDLAAAQAVCAVGAPVVLAAVESLLDHSLLHRVPTDGPARFAMLTSIRDYAAGQLAEAGEGDATRDRHAEHFAAVAATWEATIGTDEENTTWAEFDTEQPDLLAAFAHSPPGRTRVWLGVALAWHGYLHGSLARADTVLDALRADDVPTDADTAAAASVAAGVVALGSARFDTAEQHLRRALVLTGARGDERHHAVATAFLGHAARALGRADEAADHYRAARASCERRGHVRGTAWAAYDLGMLAADAADPTDRATAEPLLREALRYFDDLGYDWAVAQAARGLATALLDRGAVDEGGRLLGRALTLHEQVGDRRGSAECLEALAHVAATCGSAHDAARLIGAAQAQRRSGATVPTEYEVRRLDAVDARVVATLGRVGADHEKHHGRTAPPPDVMAFALRIAERDDADPSAAIVLTTRQVQVAALVADGRTNRQIGRALGISEKTTEIHVSNIMARLDVPSRAGVAAWVAARVPSAP